MAKEFAEYNSEVCCSECEETIAYTTWIGNRVVICAECMNYLKDIYVCDYCERKYTDTEFNIDGKDYCCEGCATAGDIYG